MSIEVGASDDKGRPYFLPPIARQLSGEYMGLPEYEDPPLEDLVEYGDRRVKLIKRYEDEEGIARKSIRKIIDWSLSGPGTVVTGAIGAYEAYSHNLGGPGQTEVWISTIAIGYGGLLAHDFFRRPIVGARAYYHGWRNPYKPAAQSNERIREAMLDDNGVLREVRREMLLNEPSIEEDFERWSRLGDKPQKEF